MTFDDIVTATARIPAGTASITLIPTFGGGFTIQFNHAVAGFTGDSINVPAGATFEPDGTITYPQPFASPTA